MAEAFNSLDTKDCVLLFKQWKPVIQEAYRDLGYPEKDFQTTLIKAIKVLLEVPVLFEDVEVKHKVVTYELADKELEDLNDAQKHLLRMGPENVEIIQAKLKEFASELGANLQ